MSKTIQLTQGYEAIVDDDDYERLIAMGSWHVKKISKTRFYAAKRIVRTTLFMHREIMNEPRDKVVDHIDGNCLNNRKSNLRICTIGQNLRNQAAIRGGSSKYKGVSWNKIEKKWYTQITVDGYTKYLGSYVNEKRAAKKYDAAAIKLHGEFARLNFPI